MVSNAYRQVDRIALMVPVVTLVLAATAIPVELRPWGLATLDLSIDVSDILENIAGFVPVGIVLMELGLVRAVIVATLMSTFAETSQLFMQHRDPSVRDVVSNVIGAILGGVISAHWKIHSPELRVSKWRALAAGVLAFALFLGVWTKAGKPLSARGVTSPGTIEAHWKFDESHGRVAADSSGHGLQGWFLEEPRRVAGIIGGAVNLDGGKNYVDFSRSTALRLVGSMTISAWINSSSFPADDAAVVSQFQSHLGYQLDTTVDRGPRTIGFKLTNACGNLMARYGATPLVLGKWYHMAGVYDAEAQTLDVYLNGAPDNGFLLGPVTSTQRSSRSAVNVGRRVDLEHFEFAGSIDEVRIYSFALTNAEVAADMHGEVIDGLMAQRAAGRRISGGLGARHPKGLDAPCAVASEPYDGRLPGAFAVFGVLVAVAYFGLWPSGGLALCLVVSLAAGLLLVQATASTLPSISRWMMSLVSLAGAASVTWSVRRDNNLDHLP